MGFLRKIGKALKKVVKVAAPIAAGFIPGVGPMLAPMVAAALNKEKLTADQSPATYPVDMGPPPNADPGALIAAQGVQNRYPSPIAFAAPRAAAFEPSQNAMSRANRLMGIAKSVQHKRASGQSVPLGQRIRRNRIAKALQMRPARARLKARFDRAKVMHSNPKGHVGPRERAKLLRRDDDTRIPGLGATRARRELRAGRKRSPRTRIRRAPRVRANRRRAA